MKPIFKYFFGFLMAILVLRNSYSQTEQKEFILLNNGDTLTNIKLIKRHKQTNKYQVSYKGNRPDVKTLPADDVLKYFDGRNFYFSEQNEESKQQFVNYFADGHFKAAYSFSDKGEIEYYVQNSKHLISLVESKEDLDSVLSHSFENFNDFSLHYSKTIKYNYKSLGEFISAFNAFMFPGVYKAENYKNKQEIDFGIYVSPYNYKFTISDSEFDLSGFEIIQAGIRLENQFSPLFSYVFMPSVSLHNYKFENMVFNFVSYNLETHFQYCLNPLKKVKVILSPGIALNYNYNLSKNYDTESLSFRIPYMSPFSTNFSFDVNFKFKNHFVLYSGLDFTNHTIITRDQLSQPNYSPGTMFGIKLGIIYNIKRQIL